MSQYKTCSKCNKSLSLDKFGKDKYKSSGLTTQCKACRNTQKKLARLDPVVRESLRQQSKSYYYANKSRMADNYKKWVAKNPDRRKATTRKSQIKRRDKHASYMREYRKKKPEMRKEWAIKNPEKQAAIYITRRSRKRSLRNWAITTKEIIAIRKLNCIYCGAKEHIQVDHIVPLARGGQHRIGNLAPACRECNLSKKDKFVMEWKIGNKKASNTAQGKR